MGAPKKIFFAYSNQDEDQQFYAKISKYFNAYSNIGMVGIIDKKELFKLTADKTLIPEIVKSADITVPLLSIDFINDADCLQQLQAAAINKKVIVPVLLRDFDWQEFKDIMPYEEQMLPEEKESVKTLITEGNSDDKVFSEIAQHVKFVLFPEIKKMEFQRSPHTFYYILASLVMVIGTAASIIVYKQTGAYEQLEQLAFTALCFLMFACIGLIVLKNVFFPNKVKLKT